MACGLKQNIFALLACTTFLPTVANAAYLEAQCPYEIISTGVDSKVACDYSMIHSSFNQIANVSVDSESGSMHIYAYNVNVGARIEELGFVYSAISPNVVLNVKLNFEGIVRTTYSDPDLSAGYGAFLGAQLITEFGSELNQQKSIFAASMSNYPTLDGEFLKLYPEEGDVKFSFSNSTGRFYGEVYTSIPYLLTERVSSTGEWGGYFSVAANIQARSDFSILDMTNSSWIGVGVSDGARLDFSDDKFLSTPYNSTSPVPEPSQSLLLIAGLGVLGYTLRQSRHKVRNKRVLRARTTGDRPRCSAHFG